MELNVQIVLLQIANACFLKIKPIGFFPKHWELAINLLCVTPPEERRSKEISSYCSLLGLCSAVWWHRRSGGTCCFHFRIELIGSRSTKIWKYVVDKTRTLVRNFLTTWATNLLNVHYRPVPTKTDDETCRNKMFHLLNNAPKTRPIPSQGIWWNSSRI
jgi:hypothetical protein